MCQSSVIKLFSGKDTCVKAGKGTCMSGEITKSDMCQIPQENVCPEECVALQFKKNAALKTKPSVFIICF